MERGGKLEVYFELKSHPDKCFDLLSKEIHKVPVVASNKFHDVELHEGDWETHGSVKQWKYTAEGKTEIFKEKVDIDEANKKLTFTAVGGHVTELYKSYKVIVQVAPKGFTLTIEYEKIKEDYPRPTKYLDLLIATLKDVDSHLIQA